MDIIIGYDAGETNAVAIFDVNNNLLTTFSKKGAKRTEIIEFIEKYGNPCLICVDVKKIPEDAKKIASIFNCKIWSPKENIREIEKDRIKKRFKVNNVHERDAVSAAYFAIKENANKMRKIDKLENKEKIKAAVYRGTKINDALEPEIVPKVIEYFEKKIHEQKKGQKIEESLIAKLKKKIEELEKENKILKKIIESYAIHEKIKTIDNTKVEEMEEKVEDVIEKYKKDRLKEWQQL